MRATAQRSTLLILLATVLVAVVTMAAAATAGEPMDTIPCNNTRISATWTERADKDLLLTIRLVFKALNEPERDRIFSEVFDPKSPNYRRGLSPREQIALFGRTPGELKELSDWLSRQGFEILGGFMTFDLTVRGTVATAERAFATTIMMSPDAYQHANQTDPQIPARFADMVESIEGLDRMMAFVAFAPPQPDSQTPTPIPTPK